MKDSRLTRRMLLIGGAAMLAGCDAVTSLNAAAQPLNTFDLRPSVGAVGGRRIAGPILVATPDAPAALESDRILVRPQPSEITYLPDARWSDTLPAVFQSALIRSLAATERVNYVGAASEGIWADRIVLVRINAFEVVTPAPGVFATTVDIRLTLLDEQAQSVVGNRRFRETVAASDDSSVALLAGLQAGSDIVLANMVSWVLANAGG